jgi:hypothetical protein
MSFECVLEYYYTTHLSFQFLNPVSQNERNLHYIFLMDFSILIF